MLDNGIKESWWHGLLWLASQVMWTSHVSFVLVLIEKKWQVQFNP